MRWFRSVENWFEDMSPVFLVLLLMVVLVFCPAYFSTASYGAKMTVTITAVVGGDNNQWLLTFAEWPGVNRVYSSEGTLAPGDHRVIRHRHGSGAFNMYEPKKVPSQPKDSTSQSERSTIR